MRHRYRWGIVLLAVSSAVLIGSVALGDEVTIEASKDNTLYESPSGTISNGSGQHFFAGRTNQGFLRRGVVAFDVAGSVPDGAKVAGVTLELSMSRSVSGAETVALHRLLSDWGEGRSDAPGEEGGGTGAAPGDATWVHIFFDTEFWPEYSFGGLYEQEASATAAVAREGVYTWGSTSQMVADVQSWVDDPSSSHGWILVGNEASSGTTKRFDTKDHPNAAVHPVLRVEFAGDGDAVLPTCSVMASAPFECEGETTTVTLTGTGQAGKSSVLYAWDGPCSITDASAPLTTAECSGVGPFPFTLTVTTDGNDDGIADADEPSVACDLQAFVQDTQAPWLVAPTDRVAECTGAGQAAIELVATASDACGEVSISNSRTGEGGDAGGAFGLGLHTVAWSVTDDADNAACAWTELSVIDSVPPSLSCAVSIEGAPLHAGNWNDEDEDEDGDDGDPDEGPDDGDDESDDAGDDGGGGADPVDPLRIDVTSSDACCEPTTHAVIDIGCLQLSVTDGQQVGLTCIDPADTPRCEAFVDDQGMLRVSAASATLRADSSDCAGNSASCAVDLCEVGVPASGIVPHAQAAGAGTGSAEVTFQSGQSAEAHDGDQPHRTIRRRPTRR